MKFMTPLLLLDYHRIIFFIVFIGIIHSISNYYPAYAQVPSYVINVKNSKSQYDLPTTPPTISSATIGEGEGGNYVFSSNGVLMTAANGRKFRCYMESMLKDYEGVKEVTMNDLVNDLNKKKKKKKKPRKKKMKTIKKKVKRIVKRKKMIPAAPPPSSSSSVSPDEGTLSFYRSLMEKEKQNCALLRAGYWTYEVCPFKYVRQYHVPIGKRPHPDKKKKTPEGPATTPQILEHDPLFNLGQYEENKDEMVGNIYTQYFKDGTDKRQSIVSYHCDSTTITANNNNNNNNPSNNNGKVSVEEPTPLHYHITFKTPLLCKANIDNEKLKLYGDNMQEIEYEEEIEVEEDVQVEVEGEYEEEEEEVEEQNENDTSNTGLSKRGLNALKALNGVCLRYVESWWTYELCGGGKIRQFHVEKNKKSNNQDDAITMEFTLGIFDKDKNKAMVTDGTALKRAHPFFKLKQYYGKGTSCDLTNEPRAVFVEYECSNSQHTYIMGITETSTCTYKMSVATPLLCKIKEFDYLKKKSASYENIRCFPADE